MTASIVPIDPVSRQLEQYSRGDQRALLHLLNQLRAGILAGGGGTSIFYNVVDFGAVGDGVHDDSGNFQAAHDAMPASGGVIWIPAGRYLIGTTVTLSKPLTMMGAGMGSSTLLHPGAASAVECLLLTGTYQYLTSFGFDVVTQPQTAGAFLHWGSTASRCYCDHLLMVNFFRGFLLDGVFTFHASDCLILNGASTSARGVYVAGASSCFDITFDKLTIDSGSIAAGAGIRVDRGSYFLIVDSYIARCTSGLNVPPATTFVSQFWVFNTVFDSCLVQAAGLSPTGASGQVLRAKFSNCWFSSTSGIGGAGNGLNISAGGSANIFGVDITDCHAVANFGGGIVITPGGANFKDVHISGGEFAQNGGDGIQIAGAMPAPFSVIGVRSGNCAGLNGNTGWGININNAGSTGYRILDNDLTGNTAGKLNDLGVAPKVVANNL